MFIVIDGEGRVVARTKTSEAARRVQRTARNLGRRTLVYDERDPRGRDVLGRHVRVVIAGPKERYFGEAPAAAEWAKRHLREKMTLGSVASFYRGHGRSPFAVLMLTERGIVVTKGAGVGSTANMARGVRRPRRSAPSVPVATNIVPADFQFRSGEYERTHVLDGMAWRLRDEFVSDDFKRATALYDRAVQIQDPDGVKRYGKLVDQIRKNDAYRAVMEIRAGRLV